MAFLEWSPDLGVGEIDAPHQKPVTLLNELHAAMKQGHGSRSLAVAHKEQHAALTKYALEL